MRNIFLLTLTALFCFSNGLYGQPTPSDSLMVLIQQHKSQDILKVNLLIQYVLEIRETDHIKAFEKASEAYDIAKKLNYKRGIAKAALSISVYYSFFKLENDLAMQYALEALKIGEEIGSLEILSKANSYISFAYRNSNDSLSFYYQQKSLSLAEESGDEESIFDALINTSIINIIEKNYGTALKLLERALDYAKKDNNERKLMGVYGNLGRVHKAMNDPDQALIDFTEGIRYAEKLMNYRYWSFQLVQVGDIYKEKGDMTKAMEHLKKALKIADENKLRENQMNIFHSLMELYLEQNKYEEAFLYQSKYYAIADSVNNLKSAQNIEVLQEKFRIEKEKQLLEKEAEAEKQKLYAQYDALGIGIISLFVLLLLISRTIIIRPGVVKILGILSLLLTFEFLNLILHSYLEEITHHSPFYMLLCLVGIASLLIPLHHKVEKFIIERLVKKNEKIHLQAARKIVEAADKSAEPIV